MHVFILDPVHPHVTERLAQKFTVTAWPASRELSWTEHADAIIVRNYHLKAEEIQNAKSLKVIGKHGVGVDNIPLASAKKQGIRVVNAPGANTQAVVEHTLGLTLALTRQIPLADRLLRTNSLPDNPSQHFLGRELFQKHIGIIGLGSIGRQVAASFQAAFHTQVTGYDPFLPTEKWSGLNVHRTESLHDMLEQIDVLTIHVPLTTETHALIGSAELEKLRPTAFIINTSRGGVVDEDALYHALLSQSLAGAASDVFNQEPPLNNPLLSLPNFVATPHIGALTEESMLKTGLLAAEQVEKVLTGNSPDHVVA
jgi:D-3-phosphoglycerate dehydrogenase